MKSTSIVLLNIVLILHKQQDVHCIKDITTEFLENKTISLGKENGFIATFNESALKTNLKLKINFTSKAKIFIILDIHRTPSLKDSLPCGYMKLGILKSEHRDWSILEEGNIEYDVRSKNSSSLHKENYYVDRSGTFFMSWRRNGCFLKESVNITVTGILAYGMSNSSCSVHLIKVRIHKQVLCISESVYNSSSSKFDIDRAYEDEEKLHDFSNRKWIILAVIIIILAFLAVIAAIFLKRHHCRNPSSEPGDQPLIPINSQYRGLCYIIVNKNFKNLPQRHEETRNDVPEIENTFSISLQYRVILKENLTVQEMKKLIREISSYDSEDDDSLVIFILSHGYGGKIYGTHDKSIMCHLLLKPLYDSVSWIGKPKIIFSVACGGDDHKETTNCLIYPDNSEFVVSYATSDRNIEEQSPSFYVKSLCDCIRERLHEKTLKMILDEVKGSTIKKLNEFGVPFEKHPEYVHHLRQPFMFANKEVHPPQSVITSPVHPPQSVITSPIFRVKDFYELSKYESYRGHCLIIANHESSTQSQLDANPFVELDIELIRKSFQEYKYKITEEKNKSVEELRNIFQSLELLSSDDSLFIFIFSNGYKGRIHGKNGSTIESHDLLELLRDKESLTGKPIFWFLISIIEDRKEERYTVTYPNIKDVLVAYATDAKNPQIDNPDQSNYFLQVLCQYMREHPEESFRSLVDEASEATKTMIQETNMGDHLMPDIFSKLMKEFRLKSPEE